MTFCNANGGNYDDGPGDPGPCHFTALSDVVTRCRQWGFLHTRRRRTVPPFGEVQRTRVREPHAGHGNEHFAETTGMVTSGGPLAGGPTPRTS